MKEKDGKEEIDSSVKTLSELKHGLVSLTIIHQGIIVLKLSIKLCSMLSFKKHKCMHFHTP